MAAQRVPQRSRHRWHAPEKGSGPAFALSLLAHTLLFIAIAFVVRWKSEPVGTVSAELWSLPRRQRCSSRRCRRQHPRRRRR